MERLDQDNETLTETGYVYVLATGDLLSVLGVQITFKGNGRILQAELPVAFVSFYAKAFFDV